MNVHADVALITQTVRTSRLPLYLQCNAYLQLARAIIGGKWIERKNWYKWRAGDNRSGCTINPVWCSAITKSVAI